MGRTKRREEKGEEKTQKRKRRRKARTDVSSDSENSEDEVQVAKEETNVAEDEDTPMPSILVEDDEGHGEQEVDEQESPAKFTEKGGQIPSPLQDLHDPQADAKFEEYYMRLMTEEFGDDLNKIREAKDFEDMSLSMLIRALKQGVNIFDVEEKRSVVKEIA